MYGLPEIMDCQTAGRHGSTEKQLFELHWIYMLLFLLAMIKTLFTLMILFPVKSRQKSESSALLHHGKHSSQELSATRSNEKQRASVPLLSFFFLQRVMELGYSADNRPLSDIPSSSRCHSIQLNCHCPFGSGSSEVIYPYFNFSCFYWYPISIRFESFIANISLFISRTIFIR